MPWRLHVADRKKYCRIDQEMSKRRISEVLQPFPSNDDFDGRFHAKRRRGDAPEISGVTHASSSGSQLPRRPEWDQPAPNPSGSNTTTLPDTSSRLPLPNVKDSDALRAYQRAVVFQQPSPIITFSYNSEHVQEFTDSALRYYVDPPLGADLSNGFARWKRKPEQRARIDSLLRALSKASHGDASSPPRVHLPSIGVVCWRGVMTRILTAPYEERDAWDMNVMIINGTIYLEEHLSDGRLREKNNLEPRQLKQTYFGYAFESWCTSDSPERPPGAGRWGGDVDTNVQWCNVVKTKLGDNRIVMGGEVDCVRGVYTGKTSNFVELKTSMTIRSNNAWDQEKFDKKLLKFYFQSFLLGVPEIIVGFRTPVGELKQIQSLKTIHIPRQVRGKPGAWDPSVCLSWGEEILAFLRRVAANGQLSSVWRVRFTPKQGVDMWQLDDTGVLDVVGGDDRVGFLPRWYFEEVTKAAGDNTYSRVEASSSSHSGWQI